MSSTQYTATDEPCPSSEFGIPPYNPVDNDPTEGILLSAESDTEVIATEAPASATVMKVGSTGV